MVDYREILRLSAQGYSQRQLATTTHSSHHTVKSVLEQANKHNIIWPLDDDITNQELAKTFYPDRMEVRTKSWTSDGGTSCTQMSKKYWLWSYI